MQKVKGKITRITDSGAIIVLNDDVDGFIHRSELDWKSVNHPAEVFSIGDIVEVVVIDINCERNEITLSSKNFNQLEQNYPIGTIVTGYVTKLQKFGVFVEIEEGITGMIHTSKISDNLTQGDEVDVKVTNISQEISKDSGGYAHLNARIDLMPN